MKCHHLCHILLLSSFFRISLVPTKTFLHSLLFFLSFHLRPPSSSFFLSFFLSLLVNTLFCRQKLYLIFSLTTPQRLFLSPITYTNFSPLSHPHTQKNHRNCSIHIEIAWSKNIYINWTLCVDAKLGRFLTIQKYYYSQTVAYLSQLILNIKRLDFI